MIKIGNAVVMTLSATVPNAATFTVTPNSEDFGETPLTATGAKEVAVTNTGTVAGTPVFIVVGDDEFTMSSTADQTNPCTNTTVVAPGQSCHTFASQLKVVEGK